MILKVQNILHFLNPAPPFVALSLFVIALPTAQADTNIHGRSQNYGFRSGEPRLERMGEYPFSVNAAALRIEIHNSGIGRNIIKYSDETEGPHEVKITYKWRERTDQHLPNAPADAVSPKSGERIQSLAPRLEWSPANDPDGDRIVNYRVQVSFRPDCAWPVVSTLDRDVRKGIAFQVPRGWLNPKTTYYWRVRSEDDKGNFSPWSKVFSFTTR